MNDKTGQTFGQLTVLSLAPKKSPKDPNRYYLCRCTCGRQSTVRGSYLREDGGGTRTCGNAGCSGKRRQKAAVASVAPPSVPWSPPPGYREGIDLDDSGCEDVEPLFTNYKPKVHPGEFAPPPFLTPDMVDDLG